jgi:hypothetical protein
MTRSPHGRSAAPPCKRCSTIQRPRSGSWPNPHTGALPLHHAIDQFYTADVFMHTWDLARATGQDDRLDPDFCVQLLAGMEQMEQVIRSSGQYGARVEVPDDADPQTRLLGFIGRDPCWTPAKTPRA